ncbi:MAG: xanthine dehydrogenase family protein subunit M [Chloroflexota bacterium]|nr:xanthine dehydrogenase family protein subunit M [Chloroflexota bacterium]MDE2970015.1 xanthine dehydrogenase family protein subunit M [Chloroflexota bacterium]
MRPIEYVAPTTVDEAVAALAEKGDAARPLAGGTDILVQLRGGRRAVDRIVDVKRIPELNELSYDAQAGLRVGAAVPCHRIYEDEAIAAVYPGLMDVATLIGGIQIQGRASLGGNLCNAAPSGDSIPALIAHNAVAEVAGPGGKRDVPVEDFCTAPGRTVLGPGEFLVALRMPTPPASFGASYLRFIPRNEMDIAVAGAGASVVMDGNTVTACRVALASVAPTPVLAEEAGAALVGKEPTDDALAQAAEAARAAAKPISDMRGTAEYRTHLVGVLTTRALRNAIQRAKEA